MMTNEFLKHIASLFYAVAKADKTLSYEEYVVFSKTLDKHWTFLGNSKIELIRKEFNALQKENIASQVCFNNFVMFLHKHPQSFTKDLKTLILKSANEIAYAFAKINKSELNYMAKLSLEFKKIES